MLIILLDLLTCQNYFCSIASLLRVSVLHQQVAEHVLSRDFPLHATITDNWHLIIITSKLSWNKWHLSKLHNHLPHPTLECISAVWRLWRVLVIARRIIWSRRAQNISWDRLHWVAYTLLVADFRTLSLWVVLSMLPGAKWWSGLRVKYLHPKVSVFSELDSSIFTSSLLCCWTQSRGDAAKSESFCREVQELCHLFLVPVLWAAASKTAGLCELITSLCNTLL